MKQRSIIVLSAIVILLLISTGSSSFAGTYASGLRVTNPDSTQAFDGSFFDGTNALLWYTLNGHADTVKIWVNAGNNRVRTFAPILNVTAGNYNIAWDGKDDNGKVVLTGRYTFSVFTSDTGNTSNSWAMAWEDSVYFGAGIGLSSRDCEVVLDPSSSWFGNIILSEPSSYGYARLVVAGANGHMKTTFGNQYYPLPSTGVDPWYISIARNGDLYVSNNTLRSVQIFRDTTLMQTIQDTIKIGLPRGVAELGLVNPTLLIGTGRAVVRRTSAGVIDTVFADTNAAGYVRDIATDDSGYVYVSFGASSTTYKNVVRLSRTFVPLDTLVLPDRVTHLNVFYGANKTSNVDDIIYCRVLGANGGVFKLDFAAKSFTKLFTPSTSTSAYHAISMDILGNIYYANPSAEWMRMYVAPSSVPTKFVSNKDMNVGTYGTKIIDNFDKTAGHFNLAPNYSGSTVGIDASSSASWTSMHSQSGFGGAVEIKLIDNAASTSAMECRFLSGGGSAANNDSLAPFGWVGFWVKTNTASPGAMVAIGIDDPLDPATKRSVKQTVINDGEWHLYQWDLEDASQWTPWVVTSGNSKIKGPRASIDAVWFITPNGSAPWALNLDNVSYNPYGKIGFEVGRGDVTGDATISVLDASWILQYAVSQRVLTPTQISIADVNLSDEGTTANAIDASVILANVVGKIPFLPWKQPLPPLMNVNQDEPTPLSIIVTSVKGKAGQIVTIPISVPNNLSGLRSAEMKVSFNSAYLKIRNVNSTTLTKDFSIASKIEDGAVTIAMASGEEILHGGQILMVEAEVLQSSDAIGVTIDHIMLNDKSLLKVTSVGGSQTEIPQSYTLYQNYPNPFNPSTNIEYTIPLKGFVQLTIYDVSGREVKTLVAMEQNAGAYRMTWDASDARGVKVASGVYFYRMTAGSFMQIKKMLLLK